MPKAQPVAIDPDEAIRVSDLEIGALGEHDGVPVTEVRTTLTGADGFLSESMKLAQVHLPHGCKVLVLVEAIVKRHSYDFPKVDGEFDQSEEIETAVLHAESALFLDPDLVADVVKAHKTRIAERRAQVERERKESKGIFEFPDPDVEDEGGTVHDIRGQAADA